MTNQLSEAGCNHNKLGKKEKSVELELDSRKLYKKRQTESDCSETLLTKKIYVEIDDSMRQINEFKFFFKNVKTHTSNTSIVK